MDIHLGGGGGVEMAENMFNTYPNYTMGAVNAETNAGIHTMTRAVRILPLSLLAAAAASAAVKQQLLHGCCFTAAASRLLHGCCCFTAHYCRVVVGVRNRCQRLRT